eukprot:Protomagalhaensia_sp_Gyna_25__3675@NODE_32_length_7245_cov_75_898973_g22_i0_p4_GENE_NODE_32_length_7245_cov_75_898973_g22_i0NODE_32_length_7245_cov_75_898973_g22_i0_p4_ORF_typecomplete_len206_score43_47DUF1168/PF06658_12/1_5e25TAF4/PF05236_14/0_00045AAA_23/PF13476_6/0_063SMC_N/PF02463_19/0_084MMR1/PF08505_10/0_11Coilin_N/PF15862_5/0_22Borrelia_P83/PF05262_11/0_23DUF4629/PF15442_6/0_95Phosducin/PF02114_16/42_NODE_32_length_7245_cov_75_898973_g22_i061756792
MANEAGDFDWVTLGDGTKVQVPRLPPQEEDACKGPSGNDKGFHLLDKVRSAWGSTAGAGSDFFHVYRKQRAKEMQRQEELERDWTEKEEMRQFQERRLANFLVDQEKAKKRAEKRKRKKQAQQVKRAETKKSRTELAATMMTATVPCHENDPSIEADTVENKSQHPDSYSTSCTGGGDPHHDSPVTKVSNNNIVKVRVNDDEDSF